jgi:RNase P/RNase MRP subunit p29
MNNNFLKKEFIGKNIVIVDSANQNYMNIKGKIINETKYTFVISFNNQKKRILKKNTKFMFIEEKKFIVDGNKIIKKTEERIKNFR